MAKDVKESIKLFVVNEVSIRQDHLLPRTLPSSVMVDNKLLHIPQKFIKTVSVL